MTPSLSHYDLNLPTGEDLESALSETLGEQACRSFLALAMRELDCAQLAVDELVPLQLLELCLALSRQRGLSAVIGRSFAIRLRSYMELSAEGAVR